MAKKNIKIGYILGRFNRRTLYCDYRGSDSFIPNFKEATIFTDAASIEKYRHTKKNQFKNTILFIMKCSYTSKPSQRWTRYGGFFEHTDIRTFISLLRINPLQAYHAVMHNL